VIERGGAAEALADATLRYAPPMGVTAHFFAYDPRVYTTPPTIARWIAGQELDRELQVLGEANAWLKALPSPLGANKRWDDNLAGDFAWTCARKHVPPEPRAEIDRWLSHLFWDAGSEGCSCARFPTEVAEQELVYEHALLEHIFSLECSLLPVEPALSIEFDGDPPKTERLHQPWIYDFDGLCWLAFEWQSLFERARKAGPGWSLLRWVWY
jgi:hypothetical protein